MITASNVYWLVKLDDIVSGLNFLFVVVVILSVMLMPACGACGMFDDGFERAFGKLKKAYTAIAIFLLIDGALCVLVPTTKQAALIYAAPQVLNSTFVNETMPREAQEIYGLAKQWLTDQVKTTEK